jgi:hypothetical protein
MIENNIICIFNIIILKQAEKYYEATETMSAAG